VFRSLGYYVLVGCFKGVGIVLYESEKNQFSYKWLRGLLTRDHVIIKNKNDEIIIPENYNPGPKHTCREKENQAQIGYSTQTGGVK